MWQWRQEAGRLVHACVRRCACACVQKPPPSPQTSARQQLSRSVQAQWVQCVQLGWPPSALNGLDSQPRKKHSSKRERGCPAESRDRPGKVGRPSLPFLPAADIRHRRHFFSHLDKTRRKREDVDSRTQRASDGVFFSCRMGFSPSVVDDSHCAWIWSQGTRPCTDPVLVSQWS